MLHFLIMGELDNITKNDGFMKAAYEDLGRPVLQPIGKVLGIGPRAIRLLFHPIERWLVEKERSLQITSDLLEKKLKDVPEDSIQTPPPYIAVPLIQQICYCQDSDVLREMYANLLASAMIVNRQPYVHPAFVNIIGQLCPDEAKIINSIDEGSDDGQLAFPVVSVSLIVGDDPTEVKVLLPLFTTEFEVEYPEMIGVYLENLVRLGVFSIEYNATVTDNSCYDEIQKSDLLARILPKDVNKDKLSFRYFIVGLTSFGSQLRKACCPAV